MVEVFQYNGDIVLCGPATSYDISLASDWSRWPSRPIRSLRYIVACTKIRAQTSLFSSTQKGDPANTKHLYNIYKMLDQLGRRCINVMQMFCVCWGAIGTFKALQYFYIIQGENLNYHKCLITRSFRFIRIPIDVMSLWQLHILYSFSARIDFRRQTLTSKVDLRSVRVNDLSQNHGPYQWIL